MKLAAPQIISTPQVVNLDAATKNTYDINEVLNSAPTSLRNVLDFSKVKEFTNNNLILAFGKSYIKLFTNDLKKQAEDFLAQKFNRKITVEVIVDENLKISKFDKVKESDRQFLKDSMDIFESENFKIISED